MLLFISNYKQAAIPIRVIRLFNDTRDSDRTLFLTDYFLWG